MVIRTVREVIEALGGLAAVARLTGVETGTVSAWQARLGYFPARTYVAMTAALAERGCSAPLALWKMVEPMVGERAS